MYATNSFTVDRVVLEMKIINGTGVKIIRKILKSVEARKIDRFESIPTFKQKLHEFFARFYRKNFTLTQIFQENSENYRKT